MENENTLEEGPLNSPQEPEDHAFLDAQIAAILETTQADQDSSHILDDLDDNVEEVLDNIVADKSKNNYTYANARFLLWLYLQTSDPDIQSLMVPSSTTTLGLAHAADLALGTRNQGRKLRKACYDAIDSAKDIATLPIKLERLSFRVLSRFIVSQKKADGSFHSKSTYSNIRSAIIFLYRKTRTPMPQWLQGQGLMKDLMGSLKRIIAREKQEKGDSLESGKSPLSFSAYKYICKVLFTSEDVNAIFGHCFLTLEWSLMARADSVTMTHIEHIHWRDDCFVIFFCTQ